MMLENSSRLLRSVANRVDDQRLSSRMRRMANRRARARKILDAVIDSQDRERAVDIPGTQHLTALASPRQESVLKACVNHERSLLHELNAELESGVSGLQRRHLARVRNGLERDIARLTVLFRRRMTGESATPTWPEAGLSRRSR